MWKILTAIIACYVMSIDETLVFPKDHPPVVAYSDPEAKQAADILQEWLGKYYGKDVIISKEGKGDIVLSISADAPETGFVTEASGKTILLMGRDRKQLRYAAYSLLESFGFRRFTKDVSYIPEELKLVFPATYKKTTVPSFAWRSLLYPDCYDAAFRDWHKLDWFEEDFGIWGHSFDKLVPGELYRENPKLFAFYEGKRRPESLCMSNDTVVDILSANLAKEIKSHPEAAYFSVSQNDDVVYCECPDCRKLNEKYGGPQGSFYVFLNKIAKRFPKNKIATLAYLHTYHPPLALEFENNLYTLLCPISADRGKSYGDDAAFVRLLSDWKKVNPNLMVWDYTVQFSNYMSPFPNIDPYGGNYKTLAKSGVKGVFSQGYDAVPGDFSELRQYLLAKLLWDADLDVEAATNDFLRGYYGEAAPFVRKYLDALNSAQKKSGKFLDIYSGPVQQRETFLTTEAMDGFDTILEKATTAVKGNTSILARVKKLRLALEFAYFEQSKFYGKDKHGMFVTENGKISVKKGLTQRVSDFASSAEKSGIKELAEGGLSSEAYLRQWAAIASDISIHKGEKAKVNFLTKPAPDFTGKGAYGLTDGALGHDDFNINWIGWYGNDAEFEVETAGIAFNTLTMHFLEDQRHWIFPPQKVTIFGCADGKWTELESRTAPELTEDYRVSRKSWEFFYKTMGNFNKIKIVLQNRSVLPDWRKRKNREPMLMVDEIELTETRKNL